MNELDLILKWLRKKSGPVKDVFYHNEFHTVSVSPDTWDLGGEDGFIKEKHFFFGNLQIHTLVSGVILLTDKMGIIVAPDTVFVSSVAMAKTIITLGINYGLNLTGNGEYEGNKKVYQLGCNKIITSVDDFGAADFYIDYTFNGFVFEMN
jgi:hypothetical protein